MVRHVDGLRDALDALEPSTSGALLNAWPRIAGEEVALSPGVAAVYPREDAVDFETWRGILRRIGRHAASSLRDTERPRPPGPKRDEAMFSMLLAVAFTLAKRGFRISKRSVLLQQCARAVAADAGVKLPTGKNVEEKLRLPVLVAQRAARQIPAADG